MSKTLAYLIIDNRTGMPAHCTRPYASNNLALVQARKRGFDRGLCYIAAVVQREPAGE